MKTIGLIIKKDSFPADIPEEKAKLTGEPPEKQTEDKPKKTTRKQSKAKKPPKENEPPEIKAEESPSEAVGETDAPDEEKDSENGAE